MDTKREQIRKLVFEAAAQLDAGEHWMKNTIILANGVSLQLEGGLDESVDNVIGEVFELVGGDEELRQFMISEIEMHANAGNYGERRKERLGWKPGMTVGTPDVPEDVVAEYEGVIFQCDGCGAGTE